MRLCVYGFCLLGSILLIGCAEKNEVPKGVLPVDKMKPLVLDMMLLADYHKDRAFTDSAFNVQAANRAGFERILQLHKVTREKFTASYAYYQKHPLLLKMLTDSLANAAQRMAEAMMTTSQEPQNP
jgi:hypothetical protein